MASPNTLHLNKGFTLIEIVIAIAILVTIFGLGLFISIDFYKGYSLRSEKSTMVSLLSKARSQSASNINQVRHGVHFANPLQYILFECKANTPQCTSYSQADKKKDIVITPSYQTTITSPALPFDVVFDQLSGQTQGFTITGTDQKTPYTISINSEGRIDY